MQKKVGGRRFGEWLMEVEALLDAERPGLTAGYFDLEGLRLEWESGATPKGFVQSAELPDQDEVVPTPFRETAKEFGVLALIVTGLLGTILVLGIVILLVKSRS